MGYVRNTSRGKIANLSEFVQVMINLVLSDAQKEIWFGSQEVEKYRARILDLEREVERLQLQNNELKRREIGVSDRRVIERLSEDKTKRFDELVQELIDTEAEAAYETLQRLILKGVVECVYPHGGYRLKPRKRKQYGRST
jgi:hypothetical protein